MTISSAQSRAARALLDGLSQRQVALATGINQSQLSNFENCEVQSNPTANFLNQLKKFYESRGVEFTEGNGVRERRSYLTPYQGIAGFRSFMDDVYLTAKVHGGNICLYNSKPRIWIELLGQDWYAMHATRMTKLGNNVKVRIIVPEGENQFILNSAEHRWFPKGRWKNLVFYAYGPKLGLLDFADNSIQINVIEHLAFADEFRELFDIAWKHVAQVPSNSSINDGSL